MNQPAVPCLQGCPHRWRQGSSRIHVAFRTSPVLCGCSDAQTSRHRTPQLLATQEILVPSRGPWWLSAVSCLLQSTQAHENNRDIRLAWTGMQEHLVSTGFNQVVVPPALMALSARLVKSFRPLLQVRWVRPLGGGTQTGSYRPVHIRPDCAAGSQGPRDLRALETGRFHLQ